MKIDLTEDEFNTILCLCYHFGFKYNLKSKESKVRKLEKKIKELMIKEKNNAI